MRQFDRSFHVSLSLHKAIKVTPGRINRILKKDINISEQDLKYANDNYPLTKKPNDTHKQNHVKRKVKRGIPPKILELASRKGSISSNVKDPSGKTKINILQHVKNLDKRMVGHKTRRPNQIIWSKPGIIDTHGELQQVKSPESDKLPTLAHELSDILKTNGIQYHRPEADNIKIDYLEKFNHFNESFIPPSKDSKLFDITKEKGKTYFSSTSSMTSTLFTFYKLINHYSPDFDRRFKFKFTNLMTNLPTSFILSRKAPETFAVESDKSGDRETFLSKFGHISEALLTNETKEIENFKRIFDNNLDADASKGLVDKYQKFSNPENVYNMAIYDKFLMRSQLDCFDVDLPGNGTFDLKSRAIGEIRYDISNPDIKSTTYSDKFSHKDEFNDLIRTGGLFKYSTQARIGQMDGIFISYHNLRHYLGFEYLKIEDIDKIYFNDSPVSNGIGDIQFKVSIKIWGKILDSIREDLNSDNYRVLLHHNLKFGIMEIFAVPLTTQQVDHLQAISKNSQGSPTKHQEDLVAFNESTLDSNVLNYELSVNSYEGGKLLSPGILPQNLDNYSFSYKISRKQPNINHYNNLLYNFVKPLQISDKRPQQ
ncbi:hypothetical protein CLIB1444_07S02564 [[Candida] jaroonii]|uniref:Uncharacterized protein n=1 Tax=[Candida] jaroonii TaxID=467808 RepID=A0ACA9YAF1_9ASCO|nr:hypothetical protein CLIB1444_07S02564 [[Candida] jaroonii]